MDVNKELHKRIQVQMCMDDFEALQAVKFDKGVKQGENELIEILYNIMCGDIDPDDIELGAIDEEYKVKLSELISKLIPESKLLHRRGN